MVVGTEFDGEIIGMDKAPLDEEGGPLPEGDQRRKTDEKDRLLGHVLVLVASRR